MRHVLQYIQCLFRHSAGRPVLIVLSQHGVNVLFIRPSDVTNSEHKLRQFSSYLTFFFRILDRNIYINKQCGNSVRQTVNGENASSSLHNTLANYVAVSQTRNRMDW